MSNQLNMFAHQNTSTNYFNPMCKKYGYLQLILGPMYSGKTSALLELKKQYSYSKMSCCVINYAEDKRYHENKLSTHDKQMIECHNTLDIESFLTPDIINQHQVFLINEGQFFKNLKKCVMDLVEKHDKIVHVCGLDGDFKRDAFGEILELIPLCDDIIKKKSICAICENGTPALFSKRLVESSEVKLIGSDIYKPVCRSCYMNVHN
jgi:thymidine kinase